MRSKKSIILYSMIVSLLFLGTFAFGLAEDGVSPFIGAKKNAKISTALRFSLWPDLCWPSVKTNKYVHGLNLGIVTFGKTGYVIGADLSFVSLSNYVRGAQIALYAHGDVMHGAQAALVNINRNVTGAQVGIYNGTDLMHQGAQVGIVNNAKSSNAIQIGIINIMDNGFLPVFPFFNFPKEWTSNSSKADTKSKK